MTGGVDSKPETGYPLTGLLVLIFSFPTCVWLLYFLISSFEKEIEQRRTVTNPLELKHSRTVDSKGKITYFQTSALLAILCMVLSQLMSVIRLSIQLPLMRGYNPNSEMAHLCEALEFIQIICGTHSYIFVVIFWFERGVLTFNRRNIFVSTSEIQLITISRMTRRLFYCVTLCFVLMNWFFAILLLVDFGDIVRYKALDYNIYHAVNPRPTKCTAVNQRRTLWTVYAGCCMFSYCLISSNCFFFGLNFGILLQFNSCDVSVCGEYGIGRHVCDQSAAHI